MNHAIKPLQDWFKENAMNPVFALSEFCKHFKVTSKMSKDDRVQFFRTEESTIHEDIELGFYRFGTWEYLEPVNVKSSTLPERTETKGRESSRKTEE